MLDPSINRPLSQGAEIGTLARSVTDLVVSV